MNALAQIEFDGFAIVPGVFELRECELLASELLESLAVCDDDRTTLRRASGAIYGARNLLDLFPRAAECWRRRPLIELLEALLGPRFGLVRGLYFDKPPNSTWNLPWHRDLTIAVREHLPTSVQFRNPTTKGGVKHVEAPDELLRQMLTLRIHLDDATEENGPLQILPGTHASRDADASKPPATIYAQAGDVLAMRPLLLHSSGASRAGTARHRRIIHLEFAAREELPDGMRWRWFLPGRLRAGAV